MAKLILIPGLLSDVIAWQQVAQALHAYKPIIADVSSLTSITEIATQILTENQGQLQIVGHSMGGIIAVEMYKQAPQRIEKLALLDTSMAPQMDGELPARQKQIDLAYNEGMQALAKVWLPYLVNKNRHEDAILMTALTDMVMRADAAQHEKQNLALLNRPDGYEVASQITCPTLVLVGRQDKICRVAEHEDMANKIPNSKLEIIEDCGHFAPIERPDEVTKALQDWLKG